MIVELDGERVFVGNGSGRWQGDRSETDSPDEARPVLLLLHGAGMDRTIWVLLARWFARHGHDVVAPDLPGHGGSGGAPLESVEALAGWTWRLIDRLREGGGGERARAGGERGEASGENGGENARPAASWPALSPAPVVCAGHSMGALVCTAMAGQRPDEVEQLLLLGAGYPMAVGEPLLAAAAANERAAIDMITIYGHAHASRLGRNPVAGISVLNSAAALLSRASPGVLHTDLAACNAWRGAEAAAERFGTGRTSIVAGDADRMTPMRGTRALAALLGARVSSLDDCGHMMMSERPQPTLDAMRAAVGI